MICTSDLQLVAAILNDARRTPLSGTYSVRYISAAQYIAYAALRALVLIHIHHDTLCEHMSDLVGRSLTFALWLKVRPYWICIHLIV